MFVVTSVSLGHKIEIVASAHALRLARPSGIAASPKVVEQPRASRARAGPTRHRARRLERASALP
jgi:hypothetical protein